MFSPSRHVLIAAAGIALIAGVSLVASIGFGKAAPAGEADAARVPVRVTTVHIQPAQQAARYAAVIAPRIEAGIGFRVGGKVISRSAEVGDRVEAGTVLARLDPADLQLQASSLEAQLVSANADALNTRNDFARYAQLRQGQWTTQQEYDKRKAAMETAAAKVREIQAQLDQARNSARYAELKSDGPGIVTSVTVEPGQVVTEGQTVFKIARLGQMEAVADVSEQDVAALKDAGLSVELWSMPGAVLPGVLREISPSADASTRTFRAKVSLPNPPAGLQFGMTATLVVRRSATGTVSALPMTALTQSGTEPAVFVLDAAGDGIRLKPVHVAAYAGDTMLLADGVEDGDRVVTAGVQKLDPSVRVRVWTEPVR